ncbi:MAG TPA: hypothetical protein VIF64_17000 [Pyrinomonadaceae bacterium]|jgi:hypothetical protein
MFLKSLSPKHLVRLRKTITFRLIIWYSAFFILSTSFLFLLAYFLLSSSVRRKNREETHQKLSEYAAQHQTGGIEALKNEVGLEGRSAREDPFVRLVGPQNTVVFLNAPEHWKDFDLTQLNGSTRNTDEEVVYLETRDRKTALDIESRVLSDGSVLQVGQGTEEQEALLETFREVFRNPKLVEIEPAITPPNTLGLRSVMFTVESVDDTVARLRANGAELVGEVPQYEDKYRLCYKPFDFEELEACS